MPDPHPTQVPAPRQGERARGGHRCRGGRGGPEAPAGRGADGHQDAGDGRLEATRRLLAAPAGQGCRIIILTTFDLDHYVYAALTAGASGFLLKDVSAEHLVAAVKLVRSGDALLAPSITRRLIQRYAPQSLRRQSVHADLSELPPRELEVLRLLARGLSNAELAAHLTLSEATIKSHVARVLAKLQVRDRVQAVILAYETGLATPAHEAGH